MLLGQTAHRRLLVAGVVVHPQTWIAAAALFHPVHPALKRPLLFRRAVGPPSLELRLAARRVPVAGTKEVFELGAGHCVLNPLHVEPDVAVIGGRQRGQPFAGNHRPQPIGRASIRACGGELQFGLLPQLMQGLGVQAWNCGTSRKRSEVFNGGDTRVAQLLALALAHARHQHQVALLGQALLDVGGPTTVIPGHVLRDHLRIKALPEAAVALAQQLVPGPELIGGVALEAATTQIKLEVIGPSA